MGIKFGPAGNSDSFAKEGFKKTADAPFWISKMGLKAFEYQCGRGIKISDETAKLIGENAKKYDITMSLHTPYFINLSKIDDERAEKNVNYILQSANVISKMGGKRLVVHLGGLSKMTRETALKNSKINIKNMLNALDSNGFSDIAMCIETMGKVNVLGDLDEVLDIVSTDDRLYPCIDFGHLNSRTGGKINNFDAFLKLFENMENKIGFERTNEFHGHFSKIEYTKMGEMRHLTFEDTIYGPEFLPLAKVLAIKKYQPTIICESAGTQAEDAKSMLEMYNLEVKNG